MSPHQVRIVAPNPQSLEKIKDIAHRNGFLVSINSWGFEINAPLGHVSFRYEGTVLVAAFSAPSDAELQMLKEIYAERFANLVLSDKVTWSSPSSKKPLNQISAEVISSNQISPNFVRVRLAGEFEVFTERAAGMHFRFLFGPDGAELPSLDENGLTWWPGGIQAWHRPVFTVRGLGPKSDWIEVDIALHPGGRTSAWCQSVEVGTKIGLNGPSGSKMPTAKNLMLFGDETAMPVILRIIEQAPRETSGQAFVAVQGRLDIQQPKNSDKFDMHWLYMKDPNALNNELERCLFDNSNAYVMFAAERTQADQARQFLKASDLSSEQFRVASYWTR
jgi:NADPH-dependent ferric siderophore reductase